MKALLIASVLALVVLSSPGWSQTIEYGTDRTGSDISSFELPPNGGPRNCQGACQANTSCFAWTFVRSNWQGPAPRCYLKNAVPASTDAACCVSGVTLPYGCVHCIDGTCQCGYGTGFQLCAAHIAPDPSIGCSQQP